MIWFCLAILAASAGLTFWAHDMLGQAVKIAKEAKASSDDAIRTYDEAFRLNNATLHALGLPQVAKEEKGRAE